MIDDMLLVAIAVCGTLSHSVKKLWCFKTHSAQTLSPSNSVSTRNPTDHRKLKIRKKDFTRRNQENIPQIVELIFKLLTIWATQRSLRLIVTAGTERNASPELTIPLAQTSLDHSCSNPTHSPLDMDLDKNLQTLDGEQNLKIQGFRVSYWKQALTYIGVLLSCGVLWVVLSLRWRFYMHCTHTACVPEEADQVLLVPAFTLNSRKLLTSSRYPVLKNGRLRQPEFSMKKQLEVVVERGSVKPVVEAVFFKHRDRRPGVQDLQCALWFFRCHSAGHVQFGVFVLSLTACGFIGLQTQGSWFKQCRPYQKFLDMSKEARNDKPGSCGNSRSERNRQVFQMSAAT
ncbi:cation-transporting ATPase [Caerostris extrusa]|uniref:Cation-transporting ATPase n=1 Tax=Caerostris extrusa TaxID=172846 RepID=A0AAV4XF04_CAEEX|nr:cation-transporting ATPase [Caerostris extrusa]